MLKYISTNIQARIFESNIVSLLISFLTNPNFLGISLLVLSHVLNLGNDFIKQSLENLLIPKLNSLLQSNPPLQIAHLALLVLDPITKCPEMELPLKQYGIINTVVERIPNDFGTPLFTAEIAILSNFKKNLFHVTSLEPLARNFGNFLASDDPEALSCALILGQRLIKTIAQITYGFENCEWLSRLLAIMSSSSGRILELSLNLLLQITYETNYLSIEFPDFSKGVCDCYERSPELLNVILCLLGNISASSLDDARALVFTNAPHLIDLALNEGNQQEQFAAINLGTLLISHGDPEIINHIPFENVVNNAFDFFDAEYSSVSIVLLSNFEVGLMKEYECESTLIFDILRTRDHYSALQMLALENSNKKIRLASIRVLNLLKTEEEKESDEINNEEEEV